MEAEVNVSTMKKLRNWFERGQALAEYMPTMAGAMAISVVFWIALSGGVTDAYCKVVDAFTDPPDECNDGTSDEDTEEEKEPTTCVVTLSKTGTTAPGNWSGEWDGTDDVVTIQVDNMGEADSLSWNAGLAIPPSGAENDAGHGTIDADGAYSVTIHYPPKEEWGSTLEDGKLKAQASLSVEEPCASAVWQRWYTPDYKADLAITKFWNSPEPICTCDKYDIKINVKNNGPNNVQLVQGQGAIVTLTTPVDCVNVESVDQPSGGTCTHTTNTVTCDLGALKAGKTVTIVAHVINLEDCLMTSYATVSAAYPPDPNMSNNSATQTAHAKDSSGWWPPNWPY